MNNTELPDELKGLFDGLSKELRSKRFQKHLDTLKRYVQSAQQLTNTVQTLFQHMALESMDTNARLVARKALVSSLQIHALTLNSLENIFSSISAKAKGLVQKVLGWIVLGWIVLGWIVQNIVEGLSNFSAQLNLYTWAVEVTSGLPLVVSFSVTLTFK
ncbi:MAG: hypothetical protein ACREBQ_11930 [Nitrososphaerales archaeon]